VKKLRSAILLAASAALPIAASAALPIAAQVSTSSAGTASPGTTGSAQSSSVARRPGVEAAGSGVTLETSEPLFTVAAALNTCGYDAGLDHSLPVRTQIRREIDEQVTQVEGGVPAKRALCQYIADHQLKGSQNLAQYVSLALFLTPDLKLSFPESEMPPDALNIVNILPLLRTFADTVHLHTTWAKHHQAYDAAVAQVHDTITRMLLDTNIYLHQPVSSYDGRRFLVLLEPMLSPDAANARIYGSDYFVISSLAPASTPAPADAPNTRTAGLHLEEIRHIYLLYQIDPILYARASSTNRFLPILKTVQDAPIDFLYKNDVVAFTTECLIKAIEARTMDTGIEKPRRTATNKERLDPAGYNAALADYERRADIVRRKQVIADMRSGWVLTQYFYDKLSLTDREGISLKENMGELVYGMDVNAEASRDKKIPFFPDGSPEIVGTAGRTQRARAPRRNLTAMDQAEVLLQRNDRAGAEAIASKELAANPTSGEALYVLARVNLMEGEPQQAFDRFTQIVTTSKDPRTVAWSHVYLGRMYDALTTPDRPKALAEYRAALATPGIQPDVQAAAEAGVKQPFTAPRRATPQPNEATDEDLDPTGKKQKESYTPAEDSKPPANAPPK